jgi:ArsR family transcriptional regulator
LHKKIYKAFKALGEPTRLKIIKILSIQSMCVCELSEVLDMLQPRVSQHLRILKEAELVNENREGYWVYYSLNKENIHKLWHEFMAFLDADLKSLEGFELEYRRFAGLENNEKVNAIKNKLKNKK